MNRIIMMGIMMILGAMPLPGFAQQTTTQAPQKSTDALSFLPDWHVFAGYEQMSLKTLLNLYWKVGLIKPDNEKAVTEYIQVSDCKLYHDRFEDDFAWPETLKATRNYIKTYAPHFATQVTTIQQIGLGRYLPDKKIFQISDDTQYKSVDRMFFADFVTGRPPCDGAGFPTSAPLRAVIDVGDPFSLTTIPIPSDDFARKVIHEIDDRMKLVDVNFEERKRFAYVRLYYTVRAFRKVDVGDNLSSAVQSPAIEFIGTLDGYDITADLDGNFPIYQWVNPKGQAGIQSTGASPESVVPNPPSVSAPVVSRSSH